MRASRLVPLGPRPGGRAHPAGPAIIGLADVHGNGLDELLYFQGDSLVIHRGCAIDRPSPALAGPAV